ncbi:hypothetical protein DFH28DRAFT_979221 [Melampsora americana]|nr:hypothetical protein DFH28DRAFT_979221 [Melampsora americana]
MAAPLPMQLGGIVDDAARVGGNAAARLKNSGKSLGSFKSNDGIMATTNNLDPTQGSISKLRNTGFEKVADDITIGKQPDTTSKVTDAKNPTGFVIPGIGRPITELPFDEIAMFAGNIKAKYEDWRKKSALILGKRRRKFKSKLALLTEDLTRQGRLPRLSNENYKSWLIKLNKKPTQSSPHLKPTSKF